MRILIITILIVCSTVIMPQSITHCSTNNPGHILNQFSSTDLNENTFNYELFSHFPNDLQKDFAEHLFNSKFFEPLSELEVNKELFFELVINLKDFQINYSGFKTPGLSDNNSYLLSVKQDDEYLQWNKPEANAELADYDGEFSLPDDIDTTNTPDAYLEIFGLCVLMAAIILGITLKLVR